MIAIDGRLQHRIDITNVQALNAAGEEQSGALSTGRPCLIQGDNSRVVVDKGQEIQADYSVLFGPDEEVQIGHVLENGVDRLGQVILLPKGRVIALKPIIHPHWGRIGLQATVVRN